MKKHSIGFVLFVCVLTLFTATAYAETKVASEPVFMREGPGTQYKIILELQTNDAVEVVGQSGYWTQVKFNGHTGFVFRACIENNKDSQTMYKNPKGI